jgi:hypothetical protein
MRQIWWTLLKLEGHDEPIHISHDGPREMVQRLRQIAKAGGKRAPAKVERIVRIYTVPA